MPILKHDIKGPSGRCYGKKGEHVTILSEDRKPLISVQGATDKFFCYEHELIDKIDVAMLVEPAKDEPGVIIVTQTMVEEYKPKGTEISRVPFIMPAYKPKIKKVTKTDTPTQSKMF